MLPLDLTDTVWHFLKQQILVMNTCCFFYLMSDMHFVSKSDKFFGRHLPQTAFRSVHLRSVKSRLFFTVTSPSNHPHRDDTNYPQALEITGLLGRFGLFLLGVLQDERV
jgi:hypothetical protein